MYFDHSHDNWLPYTTNLFDYFIFHKLLPKIIVFLIHFKWKECFKLFRALYSDLFPLKNTWRFGPENRAKFLAAVCLTLPFTDIIKCKHFVLAFFFTPYSFHRLIITFCHTLSFSRFLLFVLVFWSMWFFSYSFVKQIMCLIITRNLHNFIPANTHDCRDSEFVCCR